MNPIRYMISVLLVFLVVSIFAPVYAITMSSDVNIVSNPGFESGDTGWAKNPTFWNVDGNTAHSGIACLQFCNPDTTTYPLLTKRFAVQQDVKYSISAWIKTLNVTGLDSGATIALEFYDSTGKYLSGSTHPAGIKGTNDWTLISAVTDKTPLTASTAVLIVYMRKGCTGTAWYDDIKVNPVYDFTFTTFMMHPNYRNIILNRAENYVTLGVKAIGNAAVPTDTLLINICVTDPAGVTITQTMKPSPDINGWSYITISNLNVMDGDYTVDMALTDNLMSECFAQDKQSFRFNDLASSAPSTYIDNSNRCIVDGKPFFPLGFYCSGNPNDMSNNIRRLNKSKFNCLMNYRMPTYDLSKISSLLDMAASNNVKVIFSLKDCYEGAPSEISSAGPWVGASNVLRGMVDTWKNHPAILAWYLNDELTDTFLSAITSANDYIKANDPNHLTWQAFHSKQDATNLVGCSDNIGIDDYPVLRQCMLNQALPDMTSFGMASYAASNIVLNSRPVWMVPECSRMTYGNNVSNRPPTYKEMMCESYQALVAEARGLIFFNLTHLIIYDGQKQWNEVVKVGDNLSAIAPIALGETPYDKQTLVSDNRIRILTRSVDGELYVLAVNPFNEQITADFKIWDATAADHIESGIPGTTPVVINLANGVFTDTIEPLGTRVYKLAKTTQYTTPVDSTTKGNGNKK